MPEDTVIEEEVKDEEEVVEEPKLGPLTMAQITSQVTPSTDNGEPEEEVEDPEEKPEEKPTGPVMLTLDEMAKSVEVQVDGKKVVMPLRQAINGFLRQEKFTQKMTELAQVEVIVSHLVDNPDERKLWLDRMEAQKKGASPVPVDQKPEATKVELPDLTNYEMTPEMKALMNNLVTTVNEQSEKLNQQTETIRQLSTGHQNIQDNQNQTAEQAQDDAELFATMEDARVKVGVLLGEEIDPKEFSTFVGQHLDTEGSAPDELRANAKTPDWFFMKAKSAYGERISNKQLEEYKKTVNGRTSKGTTTRTPIRTKGAATPSGGGAKIKVNELGVSVKPEDTTRLLAGLQNQQRTTRE